MSLRSAVVKDAPSILQISGGIPWQINRRSMSAPLFRDSDVQALRPDDRGGAPVHPS
jgi:hypothetical protein